MKKIHHLIIVIAFSILNLNAQYVCDFEDCTDGYPYDECGWSSVGCGGGYGCTPICSSDQNHTSGGNYSGLIPEDGSTDAYLHLGDQIFGTWGLEFWMYIPSGHEGYWNIQGTPYGYEWIVGNFFFNRDNLDPGRGYIDWGTSNTGDDTYFDFPHDEWFQIIINVDISMGIAAATWQFGVAGIEVISWGSFADGNGNHPTAYGGIDFFSINAGTNKYYLDDLIFQNSFFTIGTTDLQDKGFSSFPNPVEDELTIKANEAISKVSIFNVLGQEVYNKNIDKTAYIIDTSDLINGTYIVKVTIGNTTGNLKIIK